LHAIPHVLFQGPTQGIDTTLGDMSVLFCNDRELPASATMCVEKIEYVRNSARKRRVRMVRVESR
jgi:hypothetical protein